MRRASPARGWNTLILPVRVLGKCGGIDSDIIAGMRWAAGIPVAGVPINPTPAQIINLSLGGSGACSAAYQAAVNEITAQGVLVVASVGNDGGAVARTGQLQRRARRDRYSPCRHQGRIQQSRSGRGHRRAGRQLRQPDDHADYAVPVPDHCGDECGHHDAGASTYTDHVREHQRGHELRCAAGRGRCSADPLSELATDAGSVHRAAEGFCSAVPDQQHIDDDCLSRTGGRPAA